MKIAIIGSTQYLKLFCRHQRLMEAEGHEVRLPALDHHPQCETELDILKYNRELVEWADEVHLIWDCRSFGTMFDFGMCFALRKKVIPIYLESKKFENAIKDYADEIS